jgi:hypothetical protein
MNGNHPPRIAQWILIHFGCSPNNAVVVGDLDERNRRGCSRIWYWRQILIALIVGFIEDIWRHKCFALRAVIVGMIFLHLMAAMLFPSFGRLSVGFVLATATVDGQLPLWIYIAFSIVACLTGLASGWLTGRFHRDQERTAMLLYTLSVVLYLAGFAIVAGIEYSPLSIGGSLEFYLLNSAVLVASLFLGGIHAFTIRQVA